MRTTVFRTHSVLGSVAVCLVLGHGSVAHAGHCRELRHSYDEQIQLLETRYRSQRQAIYADYECERRRLNKELRCARRHARHHHGHGRLRVKALKRQLEAAHHAVHDEMDALACQFRKTRRQLVRRRDLALRDCRNGQCANCNQSRPQTLPGYYDNGLSHRFKIPDRDEINPHYLPPNSRLPLSRRDIEGPQHHLVVRPEETGHSSRDLHWLDVVAFLMNR